MSVMAICRQVLDGLTAACARFGGTSPALEGDRESRNKGLPW